MVALELKTKAAAAVAMILFSIQLGTQFIDCCSSAFLLPKFRFAVSSSSL
jgi:hypothetical protein